jgi:hypothetical protein
LITALCVIGAIIIAASQGEGWGWFLFFAVLTWPN